LTPRRQISYQWLFSIFIIATSILLGVYPQIYKEASSLISFSREPREPPTIEQLIYNQINQTKSVFRLSLTNINRRPHEDCFEKQSFNMAGIMWELALCQQSTENAYDPLIYVAVSGRYLTSKDRVIVFSFWVYDKEAKKSRRHSTEKACLRHKPAGLFTAIGDILRYDRKCSSTFKQVIEDRNYLRNSDLRHSDNSVVVSIDILN